MKRWSNQTETKPQRSNALHPNELGLGRIRVTQPSVRPRPGKKGQIRPELTYRLGSYVTKGDTLISQVDYEFWSLVGTLKYGFDQMCSIVPDGWVKPFHASTHRFHWNTSIEPPEGIEILISPHSRQPRLIRLSLWISLRKCSLTTYRALSKWNPVKHDNSRLQVKEGSRRPKIGQIEGIA